jgi:ribosomal protein S18 acetylase RimI-like enzyme
LFIHSRIYNDDKISRNKASLFYRRLFEALYKQPDIVRVGLFKGKRLIGFALGNRDGFLLKSAKFKLGYLGEIVIDPSFRGRGYSKLLLRRFSEIISRKVDYLEIGTQINNGPANRLYTAEGFNLVANAVTMHKWLK